jgi:hypothetical protein
MNEDGADHAVSPEPAKCEPPASAHGGGVASTVITRNALSVIIAQERVGGISSL